MNDTLVKTVFFNVPPATVWRFLTDKDKLGTWFHPARKDLAEGEAFECYQTSETGETSRHSWGEVLTADAPHRLVHTFEIPAFSGVATTVEWVLEPIPSGTRLTLTHTGVARAMGDAALPMLMALDAGWEEHFALLRPAAMAQAA